MKKRELLKDTALFLEFDPDNNGGIRLEDLTVHSGKKIKWKCMKGHRWPATVNSRSSGHGCPYCAGQKAIEGETDLKTVNPELAKEYDPDNNEGVRLEDLMAHSNKKINWKCMKGHRWPATVADRSSGKGCPYCSGRKAIEGETDLKTVNPELAKEYDPDNNEGVRLEDLTAHSGKKVNWKCIKGHRWPATVANRSSGNGCPYCSGKKAIEGETDLKTVNPKLAKEYDPDNNGGVKLEDLTAHSGKKVNWKCIKGHRWPATVASRSSGYGCPYCAGQKAIEGETDLKTVNPELAKEYDSDNNRGIRLEDLTAHSGKKVNWKCIKGHRWPATVADRSSGKGCPYCSGQKAIEGETDLKTVNPELAKEYDSDNNRGIRLEDLTAHSGQKVNWKCMQGHRWRATVTNRTRGNGCPYCSGKRKYRDK